jgi:hypothetical protein
MYSVERPPSPRRQYYPGGLDLVKSSALDSYYSEAGVSQLTGENKIDYREYKYSGTM